jgi:hypothetical protein
MKSALWIVQVLLAALFVFAGGMKLVAPIEEIAKQTGLPGGFLRFIGVAELLGGLGLVLPGLTNTLTGLTPLAAAGLTIIMIGAVVLTLLISGVGSALFPFVVGLLTCSSPMDAGSCCRTARRRPPGQDSGRRPLADRRSAA